MVASRHESCCLTFKLLGCLTGHTGLVQAVAFSPDGQILATGSGDGTIRLWTLNKDQAIQRICDTTTNTLTPSVGPTPWAGVLAR